MSERHACQLVNQPRSTQRYRPTQRDDEDALTRAIITLASQYGRFGNRRIRVPSALQRPITPIDPYSQARIIESPSMSSHLLPEWWRRSKQVFQEKSTGSPGAFIEPGLIAWDDQSRSLQLW